MSGKLYLGLVHHPVLGRTGETITTAITNVDLHDLARLSRTYDCANVFIITPITKQIEMANLIRDHWVTGRGSTRNPYRREAIERLRIVRSIEEARAQIAELDGKAPMIAVTGAQLSTTCDPRLVEEHILTGESALVLFGTGWGLCPEITAAADLQLDPILGYADAYNHLSVRSAVAIILDRIRRPKKSR